MAKYVIEKRFSSFTKPRRKDKLASLLAFAGIDASPDTWLGSRVLIIMMFGLVGLLLPFSIFSFLDLSAYPILAAKDFTGRLLIGLAIGIPLSLIIAVLFYMHLYYLIADRTKRVDSVLPDFLLMVSANLRSGMTPFAAFQAAARPEFGPLQTEILYVSSRSLGSESFTDAMRELTTTIDSVILRRMVGFFENELKAGGKLAYLLETSAEEIRETEEMRRQMMLTTKSYAIFLVFILLLGLPLLLAISTQFLAMFKSFQSGLPTDGGGLGGIPTPKMSIDVQFIDNMGLVTITGASLMSSLLIGIILEGRLLYGAKYFPPLAIGAIILFQVFKVIIAGFIAPLL